MPVINQDEISITKLIADIANFRITRSGATCTICGRRFMEKRIGLQLNESMINHFNKYHNKHPSRKTLVSE